MRACPKEDAQTPQVRTKVDPKYTAQAKRKKVDGIVLLKLIVDEQGLPQHVRILKGLDDGLNKKAVEALEKWRFYPATCKQKPMASSATVKVEFHMERR